VAVVVDRLPRDGKRELAMFDVKVKPHPSAADPTLRIEVTREYQQIYNVPLEVRGTASAEDGSVVGELILAPIPENRSKDGILPNPKTNVGNVRRAYHFDCRLTSQGLERLMNCRDRNQRKDVVLNLSFLVTTLKPHFATTGLTTVKIEDPRRLGQLGIPIPGGNPVRLVFHAWDMPNQEALADLPPLAAGTSEWGPAIGTYERDVETHTYTIRSSDWIHDFSPVLGVGRFINVELPEPGQMKTKVAGLGARLSRAITALEAMGHDIEEGEWTQCVQHSRAVVELLKDEATIKGVLVKDGFSEAAGADLMRSVRGLFDFASKFIKQLDPETKDVNPVLAANKEDAYFVYATSVCLVNLLSRKAQRQTSK
jgi:hypothetical protein